MNTTNDPDARLRSRLSRSIEELREALDELPGDLHAQVPICSAISFIQLVLDRHLAAAVRTGEAPRPLEPPAVPGRAPRKGTPATAGEPRHGTKPLRKRAQRRQSAGLAGGSGVVAEASGPSDSPPRGVWGPRRVQDFNG